MRIPTNKDVIAYLAERGFPVTYVNVLPYVNPMWMANWDAPELAGLPGVEEVLRDARWEFPQVLEEA